MNRLRRLSALLAVSVLLAAPLRAAAAPPDTWTAWLRDVGPVMTRAERGTFLALATEEDRARFRDMFWRARDPDPSSPQNEFLLEFERRLAYARAHFRGPESDQGRIYILLGPPQELRRFGGHENLVECELWVYANQQRPGLFPFMNLLFFKPRDMGRFELFHPGIHDARDLLSPMISSRYTSRSAAWERLRQESVELGQAAVSAVPGEGDADTAGVSSFNFALGRIFTLPEREVETLYTRQFGPARGSVQVSDSTRHIGGRIALAVSRDRGISFLQIMAMPDSMSLERRGPPPAPYTAAASLHIRIEDPAGRLVYQDEHKYELKLSEEQKRAVDERRVLFRDFLPLLDGDFQVSVTWMNPRTQEFFSHRQSIAVSPAAPGLLVGYGMREMTGAPFLSGGSGGQLVLADPRFVFTPADTLQGIAFTPASPQVRLQREAGDAPPVSAEVWPVGDGFRFRLPLGGVADGTYQLRVDGGDRPEIRQVIHVLPATIAISRPLVFEKVEPSSSLDSYRFVLGQELANRGDAAAAVAAFEQLPRALWNRISTPVIARAYYQKRDFARVLELLTPGEIEKTYPVLGMLANAALELNQFARAAAWLEMLRRYGDTVEVNQLLAAAYLGAGQRQKAAACTERVRALQAGSGEG